MSFSRSLGLTVAAWACGCAAAAGSDLGFELPSSDGQIVELAAAGPERFTVVCFLGAECPLARLYAPRLVALSREFADRGVRFVAVNSNLQDSMEDVRRYAAAHRIPFPLAKDYGNAVADRYGADRTPEVVVVDARLDIRYRGRIDDQHQPGISRAAPTRHDLRIALQELVAGQPVSRAVTEASGCLIGRMKEPRPASRVTYCRQVSRILQQHCVECHRAGEIGPFSLTDYDEVVGWADTILEVIDDGRMPPWHASRRGVPLANARFMPAADKQVLHEWVDAGAPYGNVKQQAPLPEFVAGWQLPRAPELVLPMRERPFSVPAEGTLEYQYFVVDPEFQEDQWVTAAQVVPGNRAVVHHAIVFVRPPDGTRFRGVGWLTAYVPGQRGAALPPGRARKVPAGSKLVFQMHYTPNGSEQQDLTKVGLLLADDAEVTHEVYTLVAIDQGFEIPPFAADFPVAARLPWLPAGGELFAVTPHMHLRGKSFRLFARGGQQQSKTVLLDVPRYDFNWQHSYLLEAPLPLSSIEGLEFTATFDNSPRNPVNPDPSQRVTWGDQTWEEMAIAFFEVSQPRSGAAAAPANAAAEAEQDGRDIEDFVDRFMSRFDADGDGQVERSETPLAVRAFGFHRFDLDGDDRLTRDEIRAAARSRL